MLSRLFLSFVLSSAFTLMFVVSCINKIAHTDFQPVPIDGWDASDALTFNVDSLARSGTYYLQLNLRTTSMEAYDFRTLYLEVRQEWSPNIVHCDTVTCLLSNEWGEVLGDGVTRFQYTFPIRSLHLAQGSIGRLRVRHLMRREILEGISDIGIELR